MVEFRLVECQSVDSRQKIPIYKSIRLIKEKGKKEKGKKEKGKRNAKAYRDTKIIGSNDRKIFQESDVRPICDDVN